MSSRWARVARGVSAAAFATFVAALSHTLGGDASPSAFALVVTLVISAAICTLLAGRSLSVWRLGASVTLSQALFHGVFSSLGTPVAAAHTHIGPAAFSTADTAHAHGGETMWLAHAIAALATIVVFLHAERAFWGISTTARIFFAKLCAARIPVTPAARPAGMCPTHLFVVRDATVLLSSMRHRGPPELTAA